MSNNEKKLTLKLRCNLTDDEKISAGKELAEATNNLEQFENDKAQIVSDFKAKITAEEARIAVLSNKLRSGYEFRDVECRVKLDDPKPGEKTTYRSDTDEKVRLEAMTDEEKQKELDLNAGDK